MKIGIFHRHFPVSMGRYIQWGFEQAGHEVMSCGPYSHGTIPWNETTYPEKWWYPPHVETPNIPEVKMEDVFKGFDQVGFKPDLFVSASDTYRLIGKCPVKHILIGTDPHVVDYTEAAKNADVYVSMQKCYANGAYWMPYGYDPNIHKDLELKERLYDVVFCGLQYAQRQQVLNRLIGRGHRVFSSLGLIYDDYVKVYNQGAIAFNYSSQNDLPARFWEGLAMKRLMVTNRVPDLTEFNLVEGKDYIGFTDVDEAVEKIEFYIKNPALRMRIATHGYVSVQRHTYANRVKEMLKDCL